MKTSILTYLLLCHLFAWGQTIENKTEQEMNEVLEGLFTELKQNQSNIEREDRELRLFSDTLRSYNIIFKAVLRSGNTLWIDSISKPHLYAKGKNT